MNRSSLRSLGTFGLASALVLLPASVALAGDGHDTHDAPHVTPAAESEPGQQGGGTETGEGSLTEADVEAQLERVRRATDRYQNVRLAEADGYTLGESCITGLGYHFVREVAESQEELAITEPNSVVYVPQEDGSLKLAAVGYVSKRPASLFGEEFTPPQTLPYYTLHAWVWEENPNGTFEHINPNITCPGRQAIPPPPES
ncbi:hypothetical protein [Streptomyces hainanensis]|uniref:Secreted protein n=1 Tax=Streptomyces hainanensis TaxID=402648 RepID=A0A4R4TFY9_9ACTN|nr:hypothetical protein [Streptomyces hainanensis]TDC73249.1 hypothetical protein E1283_19655 [Streptomyces hainanensis]